MTYFGKEFSFLTNAILKTGNNHLLIWDEIRIGMLRSAQMERLVGFQWSLSHG